MSFGHRVKIVYLKELIDILRDRRTLIAMIVVPIVLYPLLMLGSIQAVTMQSEKMREEQVKVYTVSDEQRDLVLAWIGHDQENLKVLRSRGEALDDPEDEQRKEEAEDPELWKVGSVGAQEPEALEEAIRKREVPLAVIIESTNAGDPLREQYTVKPFYDPEDFRSATAYRRFADIVDRRDRRIRGDRLYALGVEPVVITPIVEEASKVTTPGSVLGQILPLILVLMTITGAIYPAIDLTAGERERGTLETLMVCPVPVVDLVVGKFLVVTTVAIMGAALNLASVSATVYFGGFESVVNAAGDEGFPLGALPLILLSLIPFAILMSAIMIAVCSYARTFKEAQNYVTPVILAVLIPGGIAAMPGVRLEGGMLVMPVGNMVLLTRELLLGSTITLSTVLYVLFSTTLYAVSAVAIATKVFGTESVVFSDSASLKTSFMRRYMRPTSQPTLSTAVLVVAILFPVWFYVQSTVQADGDFAKALRRTGQLMPVFFVLLPVLVCLYFKVDVRRTFALAKPPGRFLLAAALLGISAWVPAHTLTTAQQVVLPIPEALKASNEIMQNALDQMSPWLALLILAVIPAISEEALFRGFLFAGLAGTVRKWAVIIGTALAFAAFHYYVFKAPVTALLGLVLGYMCWQSGSIWPAIVTHALHNGLTVSLTLWPAIQKAMRIDEGDTPTHLPIHVLVPGCAVFLVGLVLIGKAGRKQPEVVADLQGAG